MYDPLAEIASRLKLARKAKFKSAAAAARALGMNEVTVRAHESGQNGVPADVFVNYCRAYEVDPNWIMRGISAPDLQLSRKLGVVLPVNGVAQVGAYSSDPRELLISSQREVMIPGDHVFDGLEVFIVRGDHANKFYPDGAVIFVVNAPGLMIGEGDHVLVQRQLGDLIELTVREVRGTPAGPRLFSLSDMSADQLVEGQLGVDLFIRGEIQASYVRRRLPIDRQRFLELPRVEFPNRPEKPPGRYE